MSGPLWDSQNLRLLAEIQDAYDCFNEGRSVGGTRWSVWTDEDVLPITPPELIYRVGQRSYNSPVMASDLATAEFVAQAPEAIRSLLSGIKHATAQYEQLQQRVAELEAKAAATQAAGRELLEARPNLQAELLAELAEVRRAAARKGGAR